MKFGGIHPAKYFHCANQAGQAKLHKLYIVASILFQKLYCFKNFFFPGFGVNPALTSLRRQKQADNLMEDRVSAGPFDRTYKAVHEPGR